MLQRRTPLKRTRSLKRSPLRRVSKRRAVDLREYAERRKAYLRDHPVCEVWLRENGWQQNGQHFEKDARDVGLGIDADYLAKHYRAPRSTEIHHTNKRRGKMLNDERYWLAVCRENHERIEANKTWARENGYLLNF